MVAAFVAVLGGGLYASLRTRANNKASETPSTQATGGASASMRQRALLGSDKEFGVAPIGTVWGVLMEPGAPTGWATLVALSDGTASIYFSGGGGVIGGGFHDKVKSAAIELCRLASASGHIGAVVKELPMPESERARFYILTTEGVRTVEESEAALAKEAIC